MTAFVVVSVVCGVLASGLLLPAVVVGSAVADTGKAVVDQLEDDLQLPELSEMSYLRSSDGTLLTTFYSQNRVVVGLDQISQHMQDAVVALEDRRFWEHSGVDVLGMARAFINNSTNSKVQGASTLTQQLVKNSLIERAALAEDKDAADAATDFSYARKLREAKMAVALEKKHGKKKVLEAYLNIAQFGPSQYGVEAAAMYYFGVRASELSVVQAATIAAVTQQPNGLDPVNNPEDNQKRRDITLDAMLREGYITQEEHDSAAAEKVEDTLKVTEPKSGCQSADETWRAGYFCDYVVAEIRNSEAFGEDPDERKRLLDHGGLTITTTLDLKAQENASWAVEQQIPYNDPSGVGQSLTAVEPGTGRIIAMAQNRWYKAGATDDAAYTAINYNVDQRFGGSSGFQPGSTFKPFILAAWLEAGHSLQESFDGSRTSYNPAHFPASCLDGGHTWDGNWHFSGGVSKSVTAMQATTGSMNASYVAMEYKLDMCQIVDLVSRMGIARADGQDWAYSPSMVLGSAEVSPLSMATAYATFAAKGQYCPPTSIDAVVKSDGNALELPERKCSQAISADVANGVSKALTNAVQYGTGTRARMNDGRPIAGKTGTTDGSMAAWFCGYTPQLAVAIWTGYPGSSKRLPGGAFGGDIAAPTFQRFMRYTMEGKEVIDFDEPPSEIVKGKMMPVPNVTGMEQSRATQVLEDAGFSAVIGQGEYSANTPAGVVMSQKPMGSAYPGTAITLILSLGPEPVPDPSPSPAPAGTGAVHRQARSGPSS
jgi:membrane peptidoglycan carboxypeptidase